MVRNEQRRQKKLEARRTKRKDERRADARALSSAMSARMSAAGRWPVVRAQVAARLWQDGIGQAILVRRGPSGQTAIVVFLLDVYCLGVKNVITSVEPNHVAASRLSRLSEKSGPCIEVPPEHVRKLVEEAVGFALSLGLAPHPECAAALLIFGDLDSARCSTEFTFGRNGAPYYIAGPHDSPARIREIIAELTRTCGVDKFHFLVPVASEHVEAGVLKLE